MTQLRLTYFDAPGRAEPVRIALNLAGLEFEDRRLKYPGFAEMKQQGAFPLGSVPAGGRRRRHGADRRDAALRRAPRRRWALPHRRARSLRGRQRH